MGSVTQTVNTTETVQFTCTYSCHNNLSPRWIIDIPPFHDEDEDRYGCPPNCPNNVTFTSGNECVNDTKSFSITFSEVTNDLNGTIVTCRLLGLYLIQEQWYPINSFKLFIANKGKQKNLN